MTDVLDEILAKPPAKGAQPAIDDPNAPGPPVAKPTGDTLDQILARPSSTKRPAEAKSYTDPIWKNRVRDQIFNALGINPRTNPGATYAINKALDLEPITSLQEQMQKSREIFPDIPTQKAAGALEPGTPHYGPGREYRPENIIPGTVGLAGQALPGTRVGEGPSKYVASGGWFGAESKANRDIARAAQRDTALAMGVRPETVSPGLLRSGAEEAIEAAGDRGQRLGLLDVGAGAQSDALGNVIPREGGENTRALAKRAANTSPTAWGELDQFTRERYRTQAPRTLEWMREVFVEPARGRETLEQIMERATNDITPAYRDAYTAGQDLRIENPGILRMFDNRDGRRILRDANERVRLLQSTGTGGPYFTDIPYSGWTPWSASGTTPTPAQLKAWQDFRTELGWGNRSPNMAYWDQVLRFTQGEINGLKANNEAIRPFAAIRDQLRTQLYSITDNNAGPLLRRARGLAAERFNVGDAFQGGQALAKARMREHDVRLLMRDMQPAELEQVQAGYLYEVTGKTERVGDAQNLVIRLLENPNERTKARIILGQAQGEMFEAMLATEAVMMRGRRATIGGSSTPSQSMQLVKPAESWKDLVVPEAVIGGTTWFAFHDMRATVLAAIGYAGSSVRRRYNEMWADHVARKLVSQDPNVYFEGIRAVARYPVLDSVGSLLAIREGGQAGASLAQDVMPLPKDRSELKKGQRYQNDRGDVMQFDGRYFAP